MASRDDEPVPIFGTWPRIYACVLAAAVLVMAGLWLFQGWAF